jgi:hypothetical protein
MNDTVLDLRLKTARVAINGAQILNDRSRQEKMPWRLWLFGEEKMKSILFC